MNKLVDLGNMFVSDFVDTIEAHGIYKNREQYPLTLVLDEDIGAPRLTMAPDHGSMWGKYWYRSGTNLTMTNELKSIAEEASSRISFQKGDVWLDIACNDGTMFKFIPDDFTKVGIDPCDDSFRDEAIKYADDIAQDFFSAEIYNEKLNLKNKKAKVITTIAMFYDLERPDKFIRDINEVLDDDGIWVVQISYTPLMLKQMAFDNICHEHFYYHSLSSLKKLFSRNGLKIVDAALNDTNGGSIRVYAQKQCARESSFGSTPLRDVCAMRIESILDFESNRCDISNPYTWRDFSKRLFRLKEEVVSFIKGAKESGASIAGYGASTKGNTLLQFFGLDETLIDYIAERSPHKYGLNTVGTNIPIISEEEMRKMKPDYLLILPWHFINEFKDREKDYLKSGGKFIVPCPKLEIISG
jgi:ubiquinone/menaquinone biosynthesis C-methylase UbiE